MRKTRRHKYVLISVFFLIYSIIHVVSIPNRDKAEDDSAKSSDNIADNVDKKKSEEEKPSNHHVPTVGNETTVKETHNKTETNLSKVETTANKTETPSSDHEVEDKTNKTSNTNSPLTQGHADEKNQTELVNATVNNHTTTEKPPHGHVLNKITGHLGATHVKENTGHKVADRIIKHIVGINSTVKNPYENCTPPAIKQFPHPIMSPSTRRHGGLIVHVLVAVYMFLGLAIVCDEYFVASLDRICEELKMSPDVAGATFMAAGSSAPELATVIIGVFLAQDDIGISGVIGSAVFNIMFVISCCGLCSSAVIYLNWWPLIRDCFFYSLSILILVYVIYDDEVTWGDSLILLITYVLYCVFLHFNTLFESIAYSLPVPFKTHAPTEESGLVSYKTLDDAGKKPNYGMDWSPERQQENGEQDLQNFGTEWSPEKNPQGFTNQLSGPDLNQATTQAAPQPAAAPSKPIQQDYYKPKEYDPSAQVNPLIKPEGGIYKQIVWVIVYPIHWLCRLTMPDCRAEKYRSWYPFTFFISMVWISFYSYFMVWMITLIGYTLYIPDTVMGLTFVAAGVSVPDALSSIAVIKEGYGDMAVSNAVGSNVFDILVCLGLPWFLKTAIVSPGNIVKVKSKGLPYTTLSLLSTVVLLVVATHLNGWKLDRRYGIVLMIWYLIFITLASVYEFNVFTPCPTPEW